MNLRRFACVVAPIILAQLWAPISLAKMPNMPGVIVDYLGHASDYQILRDARPVDAVFYGELKGGDCLKVLRRDGAISVERIDATVQTFHFEDGEVCFESRGPKTTWVDNVVRQIGLAASRARETGVASLATRKIGDALILEPPDLDFGQAIVHAGRRTMAAAWRGGEAPFSVEIAPEGRAAVIKEDAIETRLLIVASHPQQLTPGRWLITIHDARDAETHRVFDVLDATTADPQTPAQAIAIAGQLIAANPHQAYDAALTLAPFARTSSSAAELLDAILADRPHD